MGEQRHVQNGHRGHHLAEAGGYPSPQGHAGFDRVRVRGLGAGRPAGHRAEREREDNNPTFYLDGGNGPTNYVNFVNDIRSRVSDNRGSMVPGTTSAYQVNHTVAIVLATSNQR